jgi:plastocyanin
MMDTLDSRGLRYTDCYVQVFSKPGEAYYRLTSMAGCHLPVEKEDAYVIKIKEPGKPSTGNRRSQEPRQHSVNVRMEGRHKVAEPAELTINAGDTVIWNAADPQTPGYVVQGEGPDGSFNSAALTEKAVFTHAFGQPGEYAWVDANGSRICGTVVVRALDMQNQDECKKWMNAVSEGILVLIKGEYAEPEQVEALVGQTVVWAVEKAPGISITNAQTVKAKVG